MLNEQEFRLTVVNMRNKLVPLEREQMRCLFETGTGLTTIAMILQRTEMAVIQQGMLMNLFSPPHVRKQYVYKPPRCSRPNCKVDPAQYPRCQDAASIQEVPNAI